MLSCLIVDDSSTVRKITRRILEDMKFSCEEAEDGKVACGACQARMPDIILLDWNMPVMNGLEFIQTLRTMENGTHPKVIFCTTESGMDHIQKALQAGADEYIMKPFDRTTIESKFSQLGILEEIQA